MDSSRDTPKQVVPGTDRELANLRDSQDLNYKMPWSSRIKIGLASLSGVALMMVVGLAPARDYQKRWEDVNFPSEKVLTTSAPAYWASKGADPSHYSQVGIQAINPLEFYEEIPQGTEVVVDYDASPGGFLTTGSIEGTALVPR